MTAVKLVLSPVVNTLCAPIVVGNLFGFNGLLMVVSAGNSICFSLNMFLVNAGQTWDAARKSVLFGLLRDKNGKLVSYLSDACCIG